MAIKNPKTNVLFLGDNLEIMKSMPNGFVDLCYIDPPFFTQRDYKNISSEGFSDRHLDLESYLKWMGCRITEIHRILKLTGSFYLHLDYHVVHYLKVISDEIFGYDNFRNEIIWRRGQVKGAKAVGHQFARNHDSILFYTKGKQKIFNRQYLPYTEDYIKRHFNRDDKNGRGLYRDQPIGTRSKEAIAKFRKDGRIGKTKNGKEYLKFYLNEMPGKVIDDVWVDIDDVNPMSKEKTGWPTQKPIALLERIIKASSKEGDVVFDCFVGGGTTLHASHNLKRQWIGIDISPESVKANKKRLEDLGAKLIIINEKELI